MVSEMTRQGCKPYCYVYSTSIAVPLTPRRSPPARAVTAGYAINTKSVTILFETKQKIMQLKLYAYAQMSCLSGYHCNLDW